MTSKTWTLASTLPCWHDRLHMLLVTAWPDNRTEDYFIKWVGQRAVLLEKVHGSVAPQKGFERNHFTLMLKTQLTYLQNIMCSNANRAATTGNFWNVCAVWETSTTLSFRHELLKTAFVLAKSFYSLRPSKVPRFTCCFTKCFELWEQNLECTGII